MFLEKFTGSSENLSEDPKPKKRGRKAKQANYFDTREEEAVKMFLSADTFQEKNEIYNEYLRHPLDKMISSIIRRYKLYRKDMDFREIHNDTHSFLITKVEKFKPERNKKAYSYFGTICKNYLMGQLIKDQKEQNRKISYEDITSKIENRPDMIYYIEHEKIDAADVIIRFTKELEQYIEETELNNNELKLGYALIDLFSDYEVIFQGAENKKFNKNVILLSLREMTNLNTKEIRNSMKKYKDLYYEIVKKLNNL
jgi:ribosome-binding protein aMBF1 (putative translation factor)